MRAWVLVVLVAAASLGAQQPDDKSKKVADALQGEWVVETAEYGSMKGALKELKGKTGTIKGDRIDDLMGAGKGKYTFKVDSSKSPAEIDLYEDAKLVSRRIYALDGDKLTLCLGMSTVSYDSPLPGAKPSKIKADDRPTIFDQGQAQLLGLERAK